MGLLCFEPLRRLPYRELRINLRVVLVKSPVSMKMFNIPASSGEEVVYTDHVCPAAEQTVAQMRSEKASAARHQNARFRQHLMSSGMVHFFGL